MGEHDSAELITAYWREVLPQCQTKRTAQHHAKTNNPRWVSWLAVQGQKGRGGDAVSVAPPVHVAVQVMPPPARVPTPPPVQISTGPLPAPPALSKPEEERTPEEYAELQMWVMFTKNCDAANRMTDQDSIVAAGFAKVSCQCLDAYHIARDKRVQAEIENRRLLPVAEYEALCNDARRMADLFKGMIPELAAKIDPIDPARIKRMAEDWIQERLNPVVQRFIQTGETPALLAA